MRTQLLTDQWQFNFMMDIPFVMAHVHPNAAPRLISTFITGHAAPQRHRLDDIRERIPLCDYSQNIFADSVYMRYPYGTHHTKMMVLGFDNLSSIRLVIHTANLIPFDWENMTQGAWISPMLPRGPTDASTFKKDFLRYLSMYKLETVAKIIPVMRRFDFSSIKATLVASVPGTFEPSSPDYNLWGLHALRKALEKVEGGEDTDSIIAQVSSIATLGFTDTYFTPSVTTALNGQPAHTVPKIPLNVIFPSGQNIRDSINGYGSGASIHFKYATPPQKQQLAYLRPGLCTWQAVKAGRAMAAPHIKTYMRVSEKADRIRWILLSSANLSKQAWGNVNQEGAFWDQSYEIGVLLTPAHYEEKKDETEEGAPKKVHFIPSYKRDSFWSAGGQQATSAAAAAASSSKRPKLSGIGPEDTCVAIRMPYDLPVRLYTDEDMPWSTHQKFDAPDWHGNSWPGDNLYRKPDLTSKYLIP